MNALIGWCEPLIDLSSAASHVGDYVRLLVFVRQSRLVQRFKSSNNGALPKIVVQIGDDTRAFFSVSVWHKHVSSAIVTGDIVLLQNVQIVKFRDIIEATTVQLSSLVILVSSNEVILHKRKLKKVMEWVQQTESLHHGVQPILSNEREFTNGNVFKQKRQTCKNWKVPEKRKLRTSISISEVSQLIESSNVEIYAYSGEIILPFVWRLNEESVEKKLFVRKMLSGGKDNVTSSSIFSLNSSLHMF